MYDSRTYTHCTVVDATGHKVGTVSDVVPDADTLEPRWLVVDVGLLRTGHYMPVSGTRLGPDGEILAPFDKATVQGALKANGIHVLSSADEGDLVAHYRLAS